MYSGRKVRGYRLSLYVTYCTDASTPDLFHHSLAGVTRILQVRGKLFLMVDPLGRRRGTEAVVINLPVVILECGKGKDNSDSVASIIIYR